MISLPTLQIDTVLTYLLIAFRVGGVFAFSPLLSNRSVPGPVKILLIMAMAYLLMGGIRERIPADGGVLGIVVKAILEVTIGFTIGFVAALVFAAIQMAGEIFGMQMGFSMATVFDPASQTDASVLTSFYIILGGLLFLYVDGHHLILTAIGRSFQILPLGSFIDGRVGISIGDLLANVFVFSIQISSPILVVITVLNIMFGLISKLSPQMNIYFNTGFIIGPILGLVVLFVSLPLFRVLIEGMTHRLENDLVRIVLDMKGGS